MSHSERESGSTKINSSKESMKMLQAESEKGVVRQLLFPVSSKNARNEKIQYDKNTIESFIHNPIRCGFLYAYCEENYCSENIKFAMEIDKFRDFMAADIDVWRDNKDWREMDRDHDLYSMSITNVQKEIVEPLRNGTLLDPATWPSKKIDVSSMLEQLRHIWDVYLSDDGESQICMPSKVYIHTMNRLKLAHVYGPDLFSEAMLDPIKTIRVDIQPRFVVSQHFKEMRVRMTDLSILPLPSSLNLPPPDATVRAKYSVDQLTREGFRFALDDFLVDKVLYEAFLKYLDHQRSSENLRCLQAINLFKNKINSVFLDPTLKPAAIEQGWLVYKYFIAEESAYEVSVSHDVGRDIMRELANPNVKTFEKIERSAFLALREHYHSFASTRKYQQLINHMIDIIEGKDTRSAEDTENELNKGVPGAHLFCFSKRK